MEYFEHHTHTHTHTQKKTKDDDIIQFISLLFILLGDSIIILYFSF